LGRLLQTLKNKNSEITDFASIYFPRYSNVCIEAINILAGLSLCTKFMYKTPQQYAIECDAENPEIIRATELWKHIATTCINYDLSENEISTLANFIGHVDKIHLTHYRQSVIEKKILEISQYLEATQGADKNESDSNDSDYEFSDNESIRNTTTETCNDEIEEEIASRKIIRNLHEDNLFFYK